MRISLIGAGRVAHHLAHVLSQQHQIIQIYSRTFISAQTLAAQVHASAVVDLVDMDASVDLVIMAVSDQAIAGLITQLQAYLA